MGLGAQDDFAFAQEFQQATGTTSFLMTWDASFATWEYYGVRGQPTAVLVDETGEPIQAWSGRFDLADVLEAATST